MTDQQWKHRRRLLEFLKKHDLLEGTFSERVPKLDDLAQNYVEEHIEEIIWLRILYHMQDETLLRELELEQ